jgi:hypothetical protein
VADDGYSKFFGCPSLFISRAALAALPPRIARGLTPAAGPVSPSARLDRWSITDRYDDNSIYE